jgi:hypothetical protein
MWGPALVKHRIKRVYRFLKNKRVHVPDGCRGLLHLAAKAAGGRLPIAVDWTDIRHYKVLRAAVPLKGRSVPVLFAAYRKWELRTSQNDLEEAFFRVLADALPSGSEAVVICDRGFDRAELARTLQQLGLHYVIRIRTNVWFSSPGYRGLLGEIGLRKGLHRDLGFGSYRNSDPVSQRVVCWWKKGHDEPWFLATDLDWSWRKVAHTFGLRMSIEELFRDEKNLRFGWGVRKIRLTEAHRVERLLLVLAYAYLLLLLIGHKCRRKMSQKRWAAASGPRAQASAFFIGRFMQHHVNTTIPGLLVLLAYLLTQAVEENWG